MDLVVDGVYCGACIVTIEKGLKRERGVRGARVNLASKRVTVEWDDGALAPSEILRKLDQLGYPAYPFAAPVVDSLEAEEEKRLLRCLGVAAFGAMNVMLLSVALWAGRGERRQRRDARPLSLVLGAGCDSRPSPMPGGRSSTARCAPCASARSTWTCRSPSASCCRS